MQFIERSMAAWIVACTLGVHAFGGTAFAQSDASHAADGAARSSTASAARAPIFADLPSIELQTLGSGGGARPTLSWSSVPGAATYCVTLYTSSGTAYWAWQGSDTSVDLGGGSAPLPPTAPGPKISGTMSWQVLGYDANGNMVAASDRAALGT